MAYQQNDDWMRLTGMFKSKSGSISGRLRPDDLTKLRLKLKTAADQGHDVVFVATKPKTPTAKSPVVNLSVGSFPPRNPGASQAIEIDDIQGNVATVVTVPPRPRNVSADLDF